MISQIKVDKLSLLSMICFSSYFIKFVRWIFSIIYFSSTLENLGLLKIS